MGQKQGIFLFQGGMFNLNLSCNDLV